MTSSEIIKAVAKGIQLPELNGRKMPYVIADTIEWDEGVIVTKKGRKLFVFVFIIKPDENYIKEMEAAFRENDFSCIMIIGSDENSIRSAGERFWIYNQASAKTFTPSSEASSSFRHEIPDGQNVSENLKAGDEEELRKISVRVMGDKGDKWMLTPLLLLSMQSPAQACKTSEGMISCLEIIRRFPHKYGR